MPSSEVLDLSVLDLRLDKIVEDYIDIERQIQSKAYLRAAELLSETPIREDCKIAIDDKEYYFKLETSDGERTYNLYVAPILYSGQKLARVSRRVRSSGQISRVVLRFPVELRFSAHSAIDEIANEFGKQYSYLEARFVSEYSAFQKTLFDGLDAILTLGFSRSASSHGMGYLTVTSTHSTKYSCLLASEQILKVIRKLSITDSFPMSPLDAVIGFLMDQSVDTFLIESALSTKEFVTLPFSKLLEVEGITTIGVVQNYLYGEHISVIEVCRTSGFSLQLSTSPDDVPAVELVLHHISTDLSARFEANVHRFFLRREKNLGAFNRRRLTSRWNVRSLSPQAVAAFVIELLSKTTAETIKAVLFRG